MQKFKWTSLLPIYKNVSFFLNIFSFLGVGCLIGCIQIAALFIFASGPIDMDYAISWNFMLIVAMAIFLSPALLSLLMHPSVRKIIGLKPTGGTIWTLFLTKSHFIIIIIAGVLVVIFLVGPHLFYNPFNLISSKVQESNEISTEIGSPTKMILKDYGEHNWWIYSRWTIHGAKAIRDFSIIISPKHDVKIRLYDLTKM